MVCFVFVLGLVLMFLFLYMCTFIFLNHCSKMVFGTPLKLPKYLKLFFFVCNKLICNIQFTVNVKC